MKKHPSSTYNILYNLMDTRMISWDFFRKTDVDAINSRRTSSVVSRTHCGNWGWRGWRGWLLMDFWPWQRGVERRQFSTQKKRCVQGQTVNARGSILRICISLAMVSMVMWALRSTAKSRLLHGWSQPTREPYLTNHYNPLQELTYHSVTKIDWLLSPQTLTVYFNRHRCVLPHIHDKLACLQALTGSWWNILTDSLLRPEWCVVFG